MIAPDIIPIKFLPYAASACKFSCWIRKPGLPDIRCEHEKIKQARATMATGASKQSFQRNCLLPLRVSCNQKSAKDWRNTWEFLSKLKKTSPQQIYDARIKSPVGDISVVTLIKADVTLDHSQKAEKVCETQNVQHFFQTKKKPNVIESGFAFAKSTISKPAIKQGSCSQANYL